MVFNRGKNDCLGIFGFLYHKIPLILASMAVVSMGTAVNLGFAWVLKVIIDEALPQKQLTTLVWAILAMIMLPVLSTLLTSGGSRMTEDIGSEFTDFLQRKVFAKIIRLSPGIINEFHLGDLVGRLRHSCMEVGDVLVKAAFLPVISGGFMFIGTLGVMLVANWKLTLILLIIILVLVNLSMVTRSKLGLDSELVHQLSTNGNIYFTEVISGIKTVQAYGQEQRECNHLNQWIKDYRQATRQQKFNTIWLFDLFNRFEQSLCVGLVFTFGAWQVFNDQLSVGSLIMFNVYVPQLYSNIKRFPNAYTHYVKLKPALEQISEILELPEKVTDTPQAIPLPNINEGIRFQNVSFSYAKGRGEVKNISFDVNKGEMLGIVGPTGGGKSTLLDLIMRFYDPDEGEIVIDGKNIREYQLKDLRKQIGLVSQDIFLWSGSIRDNLTYVDPTVTAEQIKAACKIAQLYDFIESLPEGYDTIVGDRGIKLSGGERQRMAIARTILRDPQVILLDEPTSALDAVTESLLQKQLEKLFEGKTVIVVAHRLTTIRKANRIIVVDNGRIAESGTHSELLRQQGIYAKMYSNQLELKRA